jgi:Domain of unknown function (DUF4258)
MGYEILEKKSKAELAKIIRNTAKDTKTVIITIHVGARMRERKISAPEVYENLRLGTIRQEPEPNVRKGSLECRMERYIAGRNIAVVVALCDEDPDVIVVTAFIVD